MGESSQASEWAVIALKTLECGEDLAVVAGFIWICAGPFAAEPACVFMGIDHCAIEENFPNTVHGAGCARVRGASPLPQ
ncbi:hypothetical protein DMX11_17420 [Pseudomonas sp. LB-090624]|nr:hypothetical protein DMX11_17420 [Pseudomonas sp. LB-090624]